MRRARRQPGFALIVVLILVAMASILGVSYLFGASLHVTGATNLVAADRARYLAESGLEHSLYLLQTHPAALQASSSSAPLGPFFVDASNDTYTLYAAPGAGTDGLYTILATGRSGGMKQTASFTVYNSGVYADLILSHAPAGYWRLGEIAGGVAGDTAGAHHGAYVNGVVLNRPGALTGADNTAAHFDGVNDCIHTGNWSLAHPGGGLTLMAWLRTDDLHLAKDATILAKADKDGAGDRYWSLDNKGSDDKLELWFIVKTVRGKGELKIDLQNIYQAIGKFLWHEKFFM